MGRQSPGSIILAQPRSRSAVIVPVVTSPSGRPPIRTFKPRRRPLTPERAAQWERLAPSRLLAESGRAFDAIEAFGRAAPLVLDVGIGFGESTVEMALADPASDVIGADVHTPGIAAAMVRAHELWLPNVRLVHGDAMIFVDRLPTASLAGIRIFFPDPWPKARHRHRRITSEERIDRLTDLLAPDGTLHIATDVADYADMTERVCDGHRLLDGGVIERPAWRPSTRYERKGLAAGREVTDLVYRKISRAAR